MTRLPLPIPAPIPQSYIPRSTLRTIPSTTPIEYILAILSRDGGVIISDFIPKEDLTSIDTELTPWTSAHKPASTSATNGAFTTIPSQTTLIPGLVGKSPTIARICTDHPTLEALRTRILVDEWCINREESVEPNRLDPLLSLSVAMNIGYGAPRQLLHRDDNVHHVRHEYQMKAGSALIFLASAYHGGGHNSLPGTVRNMYGLFFCRGHLRTEENQFLAIPRSVVTKMSPKMLALLGYKKPTTALGIVDNISPDEDIEGVWERVVQ
ncbi:hypothetical protein CBS63078_6899 [Aspergillus niger]|nr:hypothetical protein CBS63078_6899 [Aspergillus niger]KAI2919173.1 hypothetical protein CBS147371_3878 [Aspergillus niger]KAI2985322.1 hypothetical protein CBS147344_6307 [Aspergillus niger]KAI2996981.1 hypothetical protein CBS147346_8973 [Aspergillus niger]KAI3001034.1 hypothetical protein CBS147482_6951 [Aspergillus niger]